MGVLYTQSTADVRCSSHVHIAWCLFRISAGDVIGHLELNGDNDEISLTIDDENDYFSFDPISRNISVTSPIVHRDRGYRLTLTCRVVDPFSDFEVRTKSTYKRMYVVFV